MRALDLLQRAAGKPPAYLVRRGLFELRRSARASWLPGRIRALSEASLGGETGGRSAADLWRSVADRGFFLDRGEGEALRRLYQNRYAKEAARMRIRMETILRHEFDLLGSGPTSLGAEIDWQADFKSGRRWDLAPSHRIDYAELDRPSDVKVPWELSRGQHLTDLARAWIAFGDQRCVDEFQLQIESWLQSNPVGQGVNWICTMDVALRILSWIWSARIFADSLSPDFRDHLIVAIFQHGWWISENLEVRDINGNHLISDAIGLAACGGFFALTAKGERWLRTATEILEREIRLQVADDGVDCEASVPYHRLVLEIFLVGKMVLEFAGIKPSPEYSRRLESMFEFVNAYTGADGLSPVIGDADDGRALTLGSTDIRDHRYLLSTGSVLFKRPEWKARAGNFWEDSLWLLGSRALAEFDALPCSEGTEESREFRDSGFYILRSPDHYLFADFGPAGFHGCGGHGHNDCLSFEWHALGRQVLTDSGAFVYTASPQWRNRFRSTEFHNTIRVDDQEINRFPSPLALWSLHNDAIPTKVSFRRSQDRDSIAGGHSGYRRLPGKVMVFRTIEFDRHRPALEITDRIDGNGSHRIEFFFHAAPGSKPCSEGDLQAQFILDGLQVSIKPAPDRDIEWEIRDGWFSPSYGIKIARPVWVATMAAELPVQVRWKLSVGTQPGA